MIEFRGKRVDSEGRSVFPLLTTGAVAGANCSSAARGKGTTEVVETGLFTHPAAVLDLATLLPAVVICAVMLLRRKAIAFVLAPALIAFMLLMTLSIEGMGIGMYLTGFTPRRALVSFSAGAAVMCVILTSLLIRFLYPGKAMAVASVANVAHGIHF